MAHRILSGVCINESDKPGAVFYDGTTNRAEGPVFDSVEEAEAFESYLCGISPMRLDWGGDPIMNNGEALYKQWIGEGKPSKRPVVQFDPKKLVPPDNDVQDWTFICEMTRVCFPLFLGLNCHKVEAILKEGKVLVEGDETDTESSCVYAYFKTKERGEAFIQRLNGWLRDNWHKAYPEKA